MKQYFIADNFYFIKYTKTILTVITFSAALTAAASLSFRGVMSSLNPEERLRYTGNMMIVSVFLLLYLVLYINARLNKFLLQYQIVRSPRKRCIYNAFFLCALIWGSVIYILSSLLCLAIEMVFMHDYFDRNAVNRLIGFISVQAAGFIRLLLMGIVIYIMLRKVLAAAILPFIISAILLCVAALVVLILPGHCQLYAIKFLVCTIPCSLTYSEVIAEYIDPYIYAAAFGIEVFIIYRTGLRIFEKGEHKIKFINKQNSENTDQIKS